MATRITTERKPWHYTESGLANVYLVGIEVEVKADTGAEEPIIPQIEDLHQCIFLDLICKPGPLTGREVRYLRRHLLWTQAQAAKVLGFNGPEYVCMVERKKKDNRCFSHIGVDFFWRFACLEEFHRRATGLRKYQSGSILKSFGKVREKVRKPKERAKVKIKQTETSYGKVWESPQLRAA